MMSKKQLREAIINSLPDSIMCHILSFLPTKDAVATSILSKRWKPLWLSVFILDFSTHSRFIKTTDILSHVNSIILSRDNLLPIQFFSLKCCSKDSSDDPNVIIQLVNKLVTIALQRGNQTLHLDLSFHILDIKLASNIFTCRTLTFLKLQNLRIKHVPQINEKISPIKTLHLDTIFMNDRTQLIDLLLLFPNLEELQTNKVRLVTYPRFVPTAHDKIKFLPNLVTAKLSNNEPIPLFLLSRALTTLSLKLTYPRAVHVPIFYNLTQMETFFNLYDWKYNWTKKWMWMLEMLQHTPKLQYLIIHDEDLEKPDDIEDIDGEGEADWEDPKIVPECLSSQLKTCLYSNYRGNKCEFQFTQYVMRNSRVLSKMTIKSACP